MIALDAADDFVHLRLYLSGVFEDHVVDQPRDAESGPAEVPFSAEKSSSFMKGLQIGRGFVRETLSHHHRTPPYQSRAGWLALLAPLLLLLAQHIVEETRSFQSIGSISFLWMALGLGLGLVCEEAYRILRTSTEQRTATDSVADCNLTSTAECGESLLTFGATILASALPEASEAPDAPVFSPAMDSVRLCDLTELLAVLLVVRMLSTVVGLSMSVGTEGPPFEVPFLTGVNLPRMA